MPIGISAVITAYNRENVIRRAVESVLGQTRPASEVILIDDGSTDDTKNIVDQYGKKVRYVHQDNRGVAGARNRGVSEARREWIAFLDSDDWWRPNYLEGMLDAIQATDGKADLYFCDIQRDASNEKSLHWRSCGFNIDLPYVLKMRAPDWAFLSPQPMMLQTSIFKREIFRSIGGLPRDLTTREDTYFFYRMALYNSICAVSFCGAIMGSDGHNRLVGSDGRGRPLEKHNLKRGIAYWDNTISLYRRLVKDAGELESEYLERLKHCLAFAYICGARVMMKKRRYLEMGGHLVKSFCCRPASFMQEVYASFKRQISHRVRIP